MWNPLRTPRSYAHQSGRVIPLQESTTYNPYVWNYHTLATVLIISESEARGSPQTIDGCLCNQVP